MSEAITTARPYAQAAFDVAQTSGALKSWSEMLLSLAEVASHAEVRSVVSNPRVAKEKIDELMSAFIGDGASVQQQNFVRVLVDNKRVLLLPEMAVIFEALRAEAEKTINVVVDSAFELSAKQQAKITSSLKKRFGQEITLTSNVNKELLGGIVIRAGDKVIDGSARTRLSEMANALA
ncbi:MAG: F0F1 ATP synthase subunit delta [Gallionella sp.]